MTKCVGYLFKNIFQKKFLFSKKMVYSPLNIPDNSSATASLLSKNFYMKLLQHEPELLNSHIEKSVKNRVVCGQNETL